MISRKTINKFRWIWLPGLLLAAFISTLLFYRLGSLSGGLSGGEQQVATTAYGWQGLWRQPLYLPLNLLRSIVFFGVGHHGQTLTRLPNALLGALTICVFGGLARAWYGPRTALLTAILFACAAWTLHTSRLASYDGLYLMALPALLLTQLALQRLNHLATVFYVSLVVWLLLLFVPGLLLPITVSVFWSRKNWWEGWQKLSAWWQRALYVLLALPFTGFLVVGLTRPGNLRLWFGLPAHLAHPLTILRQLVAVPFHIVAWGPQSPALWLGRAPILDIFVLVMVALGLYFYSRHPHAGRTRQLATLFVISWLLIALNGPVGYSLVIPLLYLCAGAGIAYLLRQWFEVFPNNPLARSVGLGLIMVAVAISCLYNLRSYFVAWPNDPATHAVFQYHRRS